MSVLALVPGIILASVSGVAGAAEIGFHPAAASGNVVCMPGEGSCGENEIILSGGGVDVTLFLEVSAWDTLSPHPGDSDYFLVAYEGGMDSDTYAGGVPGNPGTLAGFDLVPVGQPDMGFEGAFQALKVCASDGSDPGGSSDLFSKCLTDAECPVGWECIDRWDYVFHQFG